VHKPAWLILAVVIPTISVVIHCCFLADSPSEKNYQKITVGMSVEEVEVLLGPGTVVHQNEVPGIVVSLNPADDARERESGSSGSPSTARNYPTRIKPLVEGDHILQWVDNKSGERILVAFKGGIVFEKNYWNPNYL